MTVCLSFPSRTAKEAYSRKNATFKLLWERIK
jgi:hypothetical protein